MTRQHLRIGIPSGLAALAVIAITGLSPRQERNRDQPQPDPAAELRRTVERFVVAADKADAAAIAATYDPEFACVRVADEGGFAHLSREQMLGFFNRPAGKGQVKGQGHAIPTKETTIHHAEVIGDTGFVLMTRIKDLGHGWEPMFYTLVWKRHDGQWRLLREYVHQKSIPKRL